MTRWPWLTALVIELGLVGLAGERLSAQEPLFSGAFTDGAFIAGGKISEWHTPQPKFNGRPLFDESKPIRWLRRDSGETVAAPKAFVEPSDPEESSRESKLSGGRQVLHQRLSQAENHRGCRQALPSACSGESGNESPAETVYAMSWHIVNTSKLDITKTVRL